MRMTVRYPIHFTAKFQGSERVKDVLCAFPHEVDIPEVSETETEVIASRRVNFRGYKPRFVLREYGGSLFRRVGSVDGASHRDIFVNPLEPARERNAPIIPLGDRGFSDRPLGVGMWNRIAHRLYVDGGRKREDRAWPHLSQRQMPKNQRCRSAVRYEELPVRAAAIDEAMFEACRKEHKAEADKLLVVGDEVYVRTPPLVWEVHHDIGWSLEVGVMVDMVYLPEWLDADLDRQFFPLSMMEEAYEYANTLHSLLKGGGKGWITDGFFRCEFKPVLSELSMFGFEWEGYTSARNLMLLATDVTKVLTDHPEMETLLHAQEIESLREVSAAGLALGAEIEDWADVSDHAERVVSSWRKTGRRQAWANIPPSRGVIGEMICEHTLEAVAGMPIAQRVDLERGFAP